MRRAAPAAPDPPAGLLQRRPRRSLAVRVVAVVRQEARWLRARARAGGGMSCRLDGPGRVGGGAGDGQPAGAVLVERRRVRPAAQRGVAGREVAGGDPFGPAVGNTRRVGPGRRGAGSTPAAGRISGPSRRRRGGRAGSARPGSSCAPHGVLPRRTRGELPDRLPGRRPSTSRAPPAAVPLGGGEPAVPGQERAGGDREDRAPKPPGYRRGPGPSTAGAAPRSRAAARAARHPWRCRGTAAPPGRTAASGAPCTPAKRSRRGGAGRRRIAALACSDDLPSPTGFRFMRTRGCRECWSYRVGGSRRFPILVRFRPSRA